MRNKLFDKYPISSVKICLKIKLIETAMRHRSAPLRKPTVWNTEVRKAALGVQQQELSFIAGGDENGTAPLVL